MTRDVIRGLVLLEGSFPVDHLNPGMKHFVHYGPQTQNVGVLDWFAMWSFERNNKRVKGMVKHAVQPLSSLANHVELAIRMRMQRITKEACAEREAITLTVRERGQALSDREVNAMQLMGVTSFRDVQFFKVATVLGVHFRAGEWGCRRCGSVITTIYRGVSRYCIVDKFLMTQDKPYARVTWLSIPIYPCRPFKLVVKVRLMTAAEQLVHRSVIRVDTIVPTTGGTTVSVQGPVLPDRDGVHFYMMREKGIDTVQWD